VIKLHIGKTIRKDERDIIAKFIKKNSGMSASVSKVANQCFSNYTWKQYSKIGNHIRKLKSEGRVTEINGRFYA